MRVTTTKPEAAHLSDIPQALGGQPGPITDPADVIPAVIAFANGDTRPNWKSRAQPVSREILEIWLKSAQDEATYLKHKSANEQAIAEMTAKSEAAQAEARDKVARGSVSKERADLLVTLQALAESMVESIGDAQSRSTRAADAADTQERRAAEIEAALRAGRWWRPTDPVGGPWDDTIGQKDAKTTAEAGIDSERKDAIDDLDHAVHSTGFLVTHLRKFTRQRLATIAIALHPAISFDDDAVAVRWILKGDHTSSRPWVRLALLLLASRARGDQTDVGRCNLESCRRFFLIDWNEGNRPRTKYCCPQHRLDHHATQAAERKRRSRAGKSAARKPK